MFSYWLYLPSYQELKDTHIIAKEPTAPAEDADIELWEQQALAHLRVQLKHDDEVNTEGCCKPEAQEAEYTKGYVGVWDIYIYIYIHIYIYIYVCGLPMVVTV
jgi:hypothetical protein